MKNLLLNSIGLASLFLLASCGGGGGSTVSSQDGATIPVALVTPNATLPPATATPSVTVPVAVVTPVAPVTPTDTGIRAVSSAPATAAQHWGKTVQLTASAINALGAAAPGEPVTYASSDQNVASVAANGLVTLVNPGSATITAVVGGIASNASAITVKGFVAATLAVAKEDNCVLDDTRTEIICWGDGYPMYPNLPLQLEYPSPLKLNMGQIPAGTVLKQVAPGFSHSCALTDAGAAYCWVGAAKNSATEIAAMGTNSQSPIGEPALVQRGEIPAGVTLVKLFQGSSSTCGLANDGDLYCWGSIAGIPRTVSGFPTGTNFYNAPVKLISSAKFADFAIGTNRSCALSEAGQLYCGRTGSTGFGNGGNAGTLTLVVNPASEVPVNVKLVKLKSESGNGGDFMTALGDDGWVYSYGTGFGRRFGNGLSTFVSADKLTRLGQGDIPVGVKVKDFSPGGIAASHCVLGDNGKAYCWSKGFFGSLGDGNLADHEALAPQLVLQGQVPASVALVSIGCGTYHCAAIGSDRKAYAWGFKEGAAIGGTVSVAVPTLINKVGN